MTTTTMDPEFVARFAVVEAEQKQVRDLLQSMNRKLDMMVEMNGTITRSTERQEQHEDMFGRVFKAVDSNRDAIRAEHDSRRAALEQEREARQAGTTKIEKEVSKWVNRGLGAWFVLAIVGMGGAGAVVYIFNSGVAALTNNSAQVQQIDRRLLIVEQSLKVSK